MTASRILSINNYHYRRGGADAVYFDHASLLESHGWESAFFSMHHPKNIKSEWQNYFIKELEFGTSYGVRDKLSMAGKVIYSFEARTNLIQLISDWKPDIAHLHCIYHHLSPSILPVLKSKGIPVVMTAHDLKVACPAYKMLNDTGICEKCKHGNLTHVVRNRCIHGSLSASLLVMLESYIHRWMKIYKKNLDMLVVPSRFYGEKLLEWGWPESKLTYIANFIHLDEYQPEYQPGDYLFYFGRLSTVKGLNTLIRAAGKANVRLLIAGTGPQEQELKEIAASVSNNKNEFLGFKSGDDLKQLIRGARAVVLPSEWYENGPISLLEAYASGKVAIGARIGGIPEMVNAETGFQFESGSIEDLTSAIGKVIQCEDATLSEMGRNARRFVEENYSPEIYYSNMASLYQKMGVSNSHTKS